MPSTFCGKRFFLTYPKADFEYEEYKHYLSTIARISFIIFAREKHEDGSPHRHVCVQFNCDKPVKGGSRLFDFNGHHPNIQSPINWAACIQYCKKDNDYEEFQEPCNKQISVPLAQMARDLNEIDFFQHCVDEKVSFQYAQYFWSKAHDQFSITEDTDINGKMCDSLKQFKWDKDLHKCLIIVGPSGCGKTTWAKINMPKPSLFVSHIDQLKMFRPGYHVSIIFDDVDVNHYPRTTQIHIVDFFDARAIHCRHTVANIPSGIYKCFTANSNPVNTYDEAIKRRIRLYNVK